MPATPSLNPFSEFTELLSLTNQWMEQEFSPKSWVVVAPEQYTHFQPLKSSSNKSAPPRIQTPASPSPSPRPPASNQYEKQASSPFSPPRPLPSEESSPKETSSTTQERKNKETLAKSSPIIKTGFQLEPLGPPPEPDTKAYFDLMQHHFPEYRLTTSPFSPSASSTDKQKKVPPVAILSFYQDESSRNFLTNLCQAIQNKLLPAAIYSAIKIEQENKWEALFQSTSLRLIIIPTHRIPELPKLNTFYQIDNNRLANIPLIPLLDPSDYLNSPSLKGPLWQAITQALKSE